MSRATVNSRGQITIPASVRSALKIGPSDRIDFIKTADDRFEVVAATREVSRLRGMVKARRAVSIEEMDSAIRDMAVNPQRLQAISPDLAERIGSLVGDVDVELDEVLSDDDE